MLIERFTQLMINSGHKFSYIKSVVLQALSKYIYMLSRDKLPRHHKRFMPLHRKRSFKSDERRLIKYAVGSTWYTGVNIKDIYRNQWKNWIRRKGMK